MTTKDLVGVGPGECLKDGLVDCPTQQMTVYVKSTKAQDKVSYSPITINVESGCDCKFLTYTTPTLKHLGDDLKIFSSSSSGSDGSSAKCYDTSGNEYNSDNASGVEEELERPTIISDTPEEVTRCTTIGNPCADTGEIISLQYSVDDGAKSPLPSWITLNDLWGSTKNGFITIKATSTSLEGKLHKIHATWKSSFDQPTISPSSITGSDSYPKEITYEAVSFRFGCTVASYCVYNAPTEVKYYIYSGLQSLDFSNVYFIQTPQCQFTDYDGFSFEPVASATLPSYLTVDLSVPSLSLEVNDSSGADEVDIVLKN